MPGPTTEFNQAVAASTVGAYDGPAAKLGGGPETVAKAIEKAIGSRRPKARYPVTPSARIVMGQRALFTDRMWDAFVGTQFPHRSIASPLSRAAPPGSPRVSAD